MAYVRNDLRLLKVQGPDARAFLNGLITQRTDLPVGAGTYAALLTPQGKLLADFPMLFVGEQEIVLGLPRIGFDELVKKLTLFKLKSQVCLLEIDGPLYSFVGAPHLAFGDSRHPDISHGFDAEDTDDEGAFHQARAALGVVEGRYDLSPGKSTLLDEGLAPAIDWDKGCFMGQEVTARMRYRALIKRLVVPFVGMATPGDELICEGKKIGEVRSTYGDYGFAHIRKEYAGQDLNGLRLGVPMGLEQFPHLYEANQNG